MPATIAYELTPNRWSHARRHMPSEGGRRTPFKEVIMNRTLTVAAVLLCPGLAVPAAYAQGRPCTHLTGTYAFYEKGASTVVLDANAQPYPYHWAGAIAPFINVGQLSIGPDGAGHGYFWERAGSFKGGLEPTPFDVTVTEMNEDCTGKVAATFTLVLGQPPVTVVERIVVFDNGRQYRAIPVSGGIPTLTWIHEGHRINEPGEPPNTCGPQTAKGRYVMTAENLVQFPTWPIYSDAVLAIYDVSMTGDSTGTLYEKLGPYGAIVLPLTGKIDVNPDCSFTGELYLTIGGKPTTGPIRGVFFDQGKKFFALNMNPAFSFALGERIDP
jgi:hypothetical protein